MSNLLYEQNRELTAEVARLTAERMDLKQAHETLCHSHDRLREALERIAAPAPPGVMWSDPEGFILQDIQALAREALKQGEP